MTERQYGQWRAAASRNTRTAGWERESGAGLCSGFVTLPFVGVLALGLFAFSVALLPPEESEHGTAAHEAEDVSGKKATEPRRKESEFAAGEKEADPAESGEAEEDRRTGSGENPTGEIEAVVHFSHNGTELTYEGIVELQRFAEEATEADASWVRIDGYGDSTGATEANLRVSLQRSEEVAAFLQEVMPTGGVEFVTAGHGAADPVADNSTEEGRARNRRVEATAGTAAYVPGGFDREDSPAEETGAEKRGDVAGVAVPHPGPPFPTD
ncbi:OmpA family protein [Thermobifida halotolerans]|uniref:OmpA family protein n=1 Tax=Thermobifida halotolerans TaxID=483545 RepID=A0AA97M4C4_9ACTN|nr:OmpA family protein [Thermobifida halotolerans]UOE19832.1 OmpA family protein [Thermobifida halotolerans]